MASIRLAGALFSLILFFTSIASVANAQLTGIAITSNPTASGNPATFSMACQSSGCVQAYDNNLGVIAQIEDEGPSATSCPSSPGTEYYYCDWNNFASSSFPCKIAWYQDTSPPGSLSSSGTSVTYTNTITSIATSTTSTTLMCFYMWSGASWSSGSYYTGQQSYTVDPPPAALALSVTPSSGSSPLTTTFTASCSGSACGSSDTVYILDSGSVACPPAGNGEYSTAPSCGSGTYTAPPSSACQLAEASGTSASATYTVSASGTVTDNICAMVGGPSVLAGATGTLSIQTSPDAPTFSIIPSSGTSGTQFTMSVACPQSTCTQIEIDDLGPSATTCPQSLAETPPSCGSDLSDDSFPCQYLFEANPQGPLSDQISPTLTTSTTETDLACGYAYVGSSWYSTSQYYTVSVPASSSFQDTINGADVSPGGSAQSDSPSSDTFGLTCDATTCPCSSSLCTAVVWDTSTSCPSSSSISTMQACSSTPTQPCLLALSGDQSASGTYTFSSSYSGTSQPICFYGLEGSGWVAQSASLLIGTQGGPPPGGGGTASNLAVQAICNVYTVVNVVVFILALTLMILGGAIYAGAQILPGQARGQVQAYAMGMILGGVAGAIIAVLAPFILSIVYNAPSNIISAVCTAS